MSKNFHSSNKSNHKTSNIYWTATGKIMAPPPPNCQLARPLRGRKCEMSMSLVWCSELRSSQRKVDRRKVDEEKDTEWSRNIAGWCGERWSREISTKGRVKCKTSFRCSRTSDAERLGRCRSCPKVRPSKQISPWQIRYINVGFKLTTCGEHTSTILHQHYFGPALFRSLPCFACSQWCPCGRLPSPRHLHQEILNHQTTSHVQSVSYHTSVVWPVWSGLPLPACTLDSTKNDQSAKMGRRGKL